MLGFVVYVFCVVVYVVLFKLNVELFVVIWTGYEWNEVFALSNDVKIVFDSLKNNIT